MKQEIILPSDPSTAQLCTEELWKSRNGNYFRAEGSARWDGATHTICTACGDASKKPYTVCEKCRDAKAMESYLKLEVVEWQDGMICTFRSDEYFRSMEELFDYCEENVCQPKDLMLVICKQTKFPEIQYDYFEDCMAEDYELPDELVAKIAEFNEFLKTVSTNSWVADNKRVIVEDFKELSSEI